MRAFSVKRRFSNNKQTLLSCWNTCAGKGWHILKTPSTRQGRSPKSMFYISAPSSEKRKRRSSPMEQLRCQNSCGKHGGPDEDHNLHPNHRTDFLKQSNARTQKKK